ncbi:peptidase M61, partial [Chamaesiphon polymorphus CCALA 037]
MTQSLETTSPVTPIYVPKLAYQIAMSQPQTHLFEVKLTVSNWHGELLDIKMPAWTPGSYLVRDYVRHLKDFSAVTSDGQKLTVVKAAKNHWQIDPDGSSEIVINYRIFANELTVRTNHLDATHGYFNPAALCFYIPGYEYCP